MYETDENRSHVGVSYNKTQLRSKFNVQRLKALQGKLM